MLFEDTGSLTMTSNSFGIHLITASKVIQKVCLAIVKHLASKSVQSVSFTVLPSSSVPKLYCFHSSFCNTTYFAYLPASEHLPSNSIKALKLLNHPLFYLSM